MSKTKPPGTVTHQIFLPEALHKQVTTIASYGAADDLIIECVSEAMERRWNEWVKQQAKELGFDLESENRQGTSRRSSPPDAGQAAAKNHGDKGSKKGNKA